MSRQTAMLSTSSRRHSIRQVGGRSDGLEVWLPGQRCGNANLASFYPSSRRYGPISLGVGAVSFDTINQDLESGANGKKGNAPGFIACTLPQLSFQPKMSLEELEPIPSCLTTINVAKRYTDISCFPMDASHGPSAASCLQRVTQLPCSYIEADNSIRMGWRAPVTAWTRKTPFGEPGGPDETVRGSWCIQFDPEGDQASCISLVDVEDKMVEYGGSMAELHKDVNGFLMKIYNPNIKCPEGERFHVTLRSAGGIAEMAEEDEQGQSPWLILSLRDGTLEDGPDEDLETPKGMISSRLSIIRYR